MIRLQTFALLHLCVMHIPRALALVVSSTALAADDINADLDSIRQKHSVPGLAAAAVRAGEVVAIGAVGVRKSGAPNAVTVDDKWHIGSCTKSMTATLAAMLVAEGKLKWVSTVGEAFPELRAKMHDDWRAVTLEQLLTHRSGAPGEPPPELWKEARKARGSATEQRLAFVRGLLALKPEAPPGSKFIYSNQGYAIAGTMIERALRKPWEELLRERLFKPLGMTSAGFGPPASPGKVDQPWGHQMKDGELVPVPPGPGADNPAAIGPAGIVHCSIRDFARYAGWHAHGARGERSLLDAAGFKRLHEPMAGADYAMGWGIAPRGWAGGNALTHSGSNTMFFCVMWVAPEKDAAFVAATNVAGKAAEKACDDAVAMLVRRYLRER